MILVRKTVITDKPESYKVGDQLIFETESFGTVSATCHKVDNGKALFICDDCIGECKMTDGKGNKGGFESSCVKFHLDTDFKPELPDYIRDHLVELSIPTYGMIFGHDDFYSKFEPDEDEQLPLMKIRKNRIADFENKWEWYWLRNATKQEVSANYFASVNSDGGASCDNACNVAGVRPYFVISVA